MIKAAIRIRVEYDMSVPKAHTRVLKTDSSYDEESVGPTGNFNLVHFQDLYYAVPQELRAVDWMPGKVDAMQGVIVAGTTEQVIEKLNE